MFIKNRIIILCFLALTGCAVNYGQPLSPQKVSLIQLQQSNEAQVRTLFGEPVAVQIDPQRGIKILTYHYYNNDAPKKMLATLGGSALGAVLGHQVGNGSGKMLATSGGYLLGAALGSNAVRQRAERQQLQVFISLATGRVINYRYQERKDRDQPWQINSGVAPL